MPWTESRSRDEWLAEVQQRGERIRRRRRFTVAVAGAFALLLPFSAVAGFLSAGPDRSVELSAAGPGPGPERPAAANGTDVLDSTELGGGDRDAGDAGPGGGPAATDAEEPAEGPPPTTMAEVQGRLPARDGPTEPRAPASVPPADDPVVRPQTTTPSARPGAPTGGGGAVGATAASSSTDPAASVPGSDPALSACPLVDVRVTVMTDKPTYAPGEVVSGSSTLENGSATACLLPTRAFFRIEDAAGNIVGSFAYTRELRFPVKAEPGKTVVSGFTWDQQDCSGSTCAQVPAGAYVAVADWTEGGPYAGRTSFDIGA